MICLGHVVHYMCRGCGKVESTSYWPKDGRGYCSIAGYRAEMFALEGNASE
jgi:hypothetical protein